VSAAKRRTSYEDLHRRGVLTYMRPGINVAATIARDWLTDHERYTSGDHVNLTGLTYAERCVSLSFVRWIVKA
jgi:hypothetical protein